MNGRFEQRTIILIATAENLAVSRIREELRIGGLDNPNIYSFEARKA
jgi:hypothetical protein